MPASRLGTVKAHTPVWTQRTIAPGRGYVKNAFDEGIVVFTPIETLASGLPRLGSSLIGWTLYDIAVALHPKVFFLLDELHPQLFQDPL
jgi:hypothetical protein